MTGISLVLNTAKVAATALVPISLVLHAQQRVLNPLFGSYPTLYSLDTVVLVAVFASVLKSFKVKDNWNWLLAGLLLSFSPNASYWIAVWTSRKGWPVVGPAVTHAVVVAPLVFVFTNFVAQAAIVGVSDSRLFKICVTFFATKLLNQKVLPLISPLRNISESQIFLTLAGISFSTFITGLDSSPSGTAKSKKRGKEFAPKSVLSPVQLKASLLAVFAAVWYIISPNLANPILSHPLSETFTHPSGKLQIHYAVQSVTGLIEVGETLPPLDSSENDPMHSARYLRADHSLLGGVWMRDKAVSLDGEDSFVRDVYGTKLGDTVYSTFVLQEAARLVDSTTAGKTGKWKNALTIGLGTGLSTTSFMRHGLNTTVVEIDPAVYEAARIWFGLPDPGPGNVFLEDARQFVERRREEIQARHEADLYDIVVHDCFSGGGVPEHIFTTEFWVSLKQIMDSEGILVVNFAGIATSDSSKMILHTLESNFKQCRAFHDWMKTLDEDKYSEEFINIVFFCTNADAPLTFRKSKRSDYLGSHLRRYIFQSLDTREINLAVIREKDPEMIEKYILTDKHNPLGDLQRKQGFHHWEASPARLPSIARPDWPWSTRSYPRGTSTSSMHSQASSATGSGHLHAPWEASRSTSSAASSSGTPLPWKSSAAAAGQRSTSTFGLVQADSTPRQWSLTGLEWVIRDVQKLRDFVEGDGQNSSSSQSQVEEFEVLRQSPIMGDKFKLEIACTPQSEETLNPPRQTLSLYLTSLMMDFPQSGEYEMAASMMVAIRYLDSRIGDRGLRADWAWQFWQHDWVFRQESEVWECPLPSLSELLQNSRIRETDSFVICVQIHSPAGPSIPEQPSVAYVPRDLLDGLEASLDNSNTGDVRFICLEKHNPEVHSNVPRESPELDAEPQHRPPSSSSSHSTFSSTTTARKRVIYAHSDILSRRSEYFATMLTSAFAEGTEPPNGERKIYTVIVEEADFETMYWLLKFCYTNWLLFKEQDDPRAAVEGVGAGWNARWLTSRNGEWDWKTFHKSGPGDDARSATSGESLGAATAGVSRSTSGTSEAFQPPPMTNVVSSNAPGTSLAKAPPAPNSTTRQPHRRPISGTSTLPVPVGASSGPSRSKPDPSGLSASRFAAAPSKHYPISPRASRSQQPSLISTLDPHPHPSPAPPPASALSMYQVAHRYSMPGLANLALEHMMTTITPQTSFALLLATTTWEELHALVQDYVIEKWEEVSASEEFEQCCQEIAAGEWGPNGGKTLTAVFRRLRSPSTAT
ncbi:hypothetical protein NP233_g5455 [Leucocoprinus birnbaumii]|uniref:BTB domain-containing protein n=1 Tax=Leucocoprinus birnbaumii TaxID=56174 RepID=A0AAD5YQY0_9AGAR|nr:hypothetical protein NP233_g5455 [Leucocoprinus birnbaumii]